MAIIKVKELGNKTFYRCNNKKCKHIWQDRANARQDKDYPKPKMCPKCKSVNWDVDLN